MGRMRTFLRSRLVFGRELRLWIADAQNDGPDYQFDCQKLSVEVEVWQVGAQQLA